METLKLCVCKYVCVCVSRWIASSKRDGIVPLAHPQENEEQLAKHLERLELYSNLESLLTD